MTGATIFLLGMVAMSNVGLVLFLINDSMKKRQTEATNPPAPKQEVEKAPPPEPTPNKPQKSLVGKSKTRIEEFDERFKAMEERFLKLADLMDKIEGRVNLQDVEFANEEDKPTEEEIKRDNAEATNPETYPAPKKDARMSKEVEANVFEDARIDDFYPDLVSAPSADGKSIEELEEAVDTTTNPNATEEQKRKAGRIILEFKDTNFFDALITKEEIMNGIKECATAVLRESVADKAQKAAAKKAAKSTAQAAAVKPEEKPESPSPVEKPVANSKKGFHIAEDINDFNPVDLIR